MKKAELMLAKKTILAHQVKMESQQIREEMRHRRPTTTSGALTSGALGSLRNNHTTNSNSTSTQHRSASNLLSPTRSEVSRSSYNPTAEQTMLSPKSQYSGSTNYSNTNTNTTTSNYGRPPTSSSNDYNNHNNNANTTNGMNRSASTPLHSARGDGNTSNQRDFEAQLAQKLAQRSVTDRTNLRKTQAAVSKSVEEELNNKTKPPQSSHSSRNNNHNNNNNNNGNTNRPGTTNSIFSNRPSSSASAAANNNLSKSMTHLTSIPENNNTSAEEEDVNMHVEDDHYFMPKKKILRADGASLFDVYCSKKGDTWGCILKSQILEDEANKIKKKQARDAQNEEYGRLLRQQVHDYEAKLRQERLETDSFALLDNSSTRQMEDRQMARNQRAIEQHKQFVANAMEDIATKEEKKQAELRQDLRASTMMVNNAKKFIAEEEAKRARERAAMKEYQDKIYQENLDNIRRRQEAKSNSHAEDRRIIEEQDRIFRREKQRREEEMAERTKRSSEGPAHHIVQKIVELKQRQDEALYHTIAARPNSLQQQLYQSETAAHQRQQANGQSLEQEWQTHTALQAAKQAEEARKNQQIQETMQALLARQEEEDRRKRERQREAQREYQRSLDAQLEAMRQRSFDSLKKTMSEAEIKFNADLIRKTGLTNIL